MMDLSDGLSSDLAAAVRASGVGAQIDEPIAAVHREHRQTFGEWKRVSSARLALHGGDDYELLFTVAQNERSQDPSTSFRA